MDELSAKKVLGANAYPWRGKSHKEELKSDLFYVFLCQGGRADAKACQRA